MEEHKVINALLALAHAQRLRAFKALVVAGQSGMTPSDLCAELNIAPSALSFHLKELSRAELVTVEPDGRYQIYRAAYQQMRTLMDYLTENCCGGAKCAPGKAARGKSKSCC